MLIFGTALRGHLRLDKTQEESDDVAHVATLFAHFIYIPLFPIRTYLVIQKGEQKSSGVPMLAQETEQKFSGIPLPFDAKSIAMGYGRAAAVFMGLFGLIWLPSEIEYNQNIVFSLMREPLAYLSPLWQTIFLQSLRVIVPLFSIGIYIWLCRNSFLSEKKIKKMFLFISHLNK